MDSKEMLAILEKEHLELTEKIKTIETVFMKFQMIGKTIKGVDMSGKEVQGVILDKVLTLQTISMKAPGSLGPGQTIPFALDAYLVQSDTALHIVQPQFISEIFVERKLPQSGTFHG